MKLIGSSVLRSSYVYCGRGPDHFRLGLKCGSRAWHVRGWGSEPDVESLDVSVTMLNSRPYVCYSAS